MIKGETILSGAPAVCTDCNQALPFEVLHSAAGYYVGTSCECGPYSRESGYFKTRAQADEILKKDFCPICVQGWTAGICTCGAHD
jgi:hypothetical protein